MAVTGSSLQRLPIDMVPALDARTETANSICTVHAVPAPAFQRKKPGMVWRVRSRTYPAILHPARLRCNIMTGRDT